MGGKASKGLSLDMEAVERHLDGRADRLPYARARSLADRSHFSTAEVRRLHGMYRRHAHVEGVRGEICSADTLRAALVEAGLDESRLRSQAYVNALFAAMDAGVGDRTGRVDFTEFILGLSAASRGSVEDKLRLSFDVFDAAGDGTISRDELAGMLVSLHGHASGIEDDTDGSSDREAVREAVERFVDGVFAEYDADRSGSLSFEQYCRAVARHPTLADLVPPDLGGGGGGDARAGGRAEWEREGLLRGWLRRGADGGMKLVAEQPREV